MTGIPFPPIDARLRMLDEALTVIRSLFTQDATTFSGEFYQLREAVLHPKPIRKPYPPILLGGGGRGLLRLAAKHADVVNIINQTGRRGYIALEEIAKFTDESYREKVAFVRQSAAQYGRDARAIRISNVIFATIITDTEAATRAAREGLAAFFRQAPEVVAHTPLALVGTAEECVEELRRRIRTWEIDQFVFAFSDESTMQLLAEKIFPHLS